MRIACWVGYRRGNTLAAGAIKHGHAVMLGTRDPKSKDVKRGRHTPDAKAGTFAEVAQFGEM